MIDRTTGFQRKVTKEVVKVERSMDGLREMLFDELDQLRQGKTDTTHAKTAASLAMTIIKSVEVQMEFEAKRLESTMPANLPAMPLLPRIKAVRE